MAGGEWLGRYRELVFRACISDPHVRTRIDREADSGKDQTVHREGTWFVPRKGPYLPEYSFDATGTKSLHFGRPVLGAARGGECVARTEV